MSIEKLTVRIVWWEDVYHRTNVSLNFCGVLYHIAVNVSERFELRDTDIYNFITGILFFKIPDDNGEPECNFKPHSILVEEEVQAKYLCNGLNDELRYLSIN